MDNYGDVAEASVAQQRAVATAKGARIVYGVTCLWWDNAHKVVTRGVSRLPCCPKCLGLIKGVVVDEETFLASHAYFDEDADGQLVAALRWSKGQCFQSLEALVMAYNARHD